jgi:hypothetical protein
VCTEASTVPRAVAADLFNFWCLEIPSDNRIRHVPRCVHYHEQGFRLETFYKIMTRDDDYDDDDFLNLITTHVA